MYIQKAYRNGTSIAVTVPKQIAKNLNIRDGSELLVDEKNGKMLVSPGKKTRKREREGSDLTTEFEKWLGMVAREDESLIKELAKR